MSQRGSTRSTTARLHHISKHGQIYCWRPLPRLQHGGSTHRWGTAIYVSSSNSYENQIWFSGNTEEALDFVCDIHIGPITP